MAEQDLLATLREENARLVALLDAHNIKWRLPPKPATLAVTDGEPSKLSTVEKISLFCRLFRGRTDVYPVCWESKSTGKVGYAPACANEWVPVVCEKPRITCE